MNESLIVRQLRKTYDNGIEALKGIDLTVNEGEFFALLGPNGAGKSTLIGIISGLVNKTNGTVSVAGFDTIANEASSKLSLGLVPQEFNFSIFSKVRDIVINQAGYYGMSKNEAEKETEVLLKKLRLWEKKDDKSRMLSGGMKRRLMIARALVHKPKVLILDEPTAGVDIETRRTMWDFLREMNRNGTTIILTTHYLEEAEQLCNRMAIIDQGLIVKEGNIKDLLATAHRESFVLDIDRKPTDELLAYLKRFEAVSGEGESIEISLTADISINEVFRELDRLGVSVKSMRNKANRLEELFIHLTKKSL